MVWLFVGATVASFGGVMKHVLDHVANPELEAVKTK